MAGSRENTSRRKPILLGIVGGSGSGKTRLAQQLQAQLRGRALRVSQDDFYLDRSHLAPLRRTRLNFDHPRAIDWPSLEHVLRQLRTGRAARRPCYDFKTHCRRRRGKVLRPKPLIIVEGLWLFRRPSLRKLFAVRVFLDCPAAIRLRRRLTRDLQARARTRASVLRQFRDTVEPMHRKYVAPQARWAQIVLRGNWGAGEVRALAARISAHDPA